MKYLKLFEEYNVQDIMSIPTPVSWMSKFMDDPRYVLRRPDVTFEIPNEADEIDETEVNDEVIKKLLPFYNYAKNIRTVRISKIDYEKSDDAIGFAFQIGKRIYYVFVDIKNNETFIIDNGKYIPIKNVNDLIDIINNNLKY